ncbi:hypothetical protein U9M48_003745 [Paspalum notatum var. saurae]|uniref:Retrotransposon gag domain-containing protein n=1 Tax=Paspalum notatum var. saurae TaxID=547442 RepID=A0AAQ3PIW6_PASNO
MVTPPETSAQGAAHGAPSPSELATQVAQQLINLIAQEKQRRDPQESSYTDFAALQPPIFTTAPDPLDADDWLRIIESKFMSNEGSLCGAMSAWSLGGLVCFIPGNATGGHRVTWDEFRAAFRAHYLPPSLIELKQREFRALRQGDMSVLEYVQAFIRLSQYSPEDVNTDPRRATRPLDGFDPTRRLTWGAAMTASMSWWMSPSTWSIASVGPMRTGEEKTCRYTSIESISAATG